jgi:hypothetical protein
MFQFNAAAFYKVTTTWRHIWTMLRERGDDQFDETPNGGVIVTWVDDPIEIQSMQDHARELRSSLLTLGTRQTSKSADRLIGTVSADRFTYPELASLLREIDSRLRDELSDITVLTLSDKEQGYFAPAEPLFGKEFEVAFPSALFELDEASKCMALGRDTAAVFHLMRCMEIGIRTIAKSLGVPDPVKGSDRNWSEMLKKIKLAMERKLNPPSWNHGDREIFESAYGSLDAVRVAWRNPTMHVDSKYTNDEAEHIFVAVRGFMKKLASRMDEQGHPLA